MPDIILQLLKDGWVIQAEYKKGHVRWTPIEKKERRDPQYQEIWDKDEEVTYKLGVDCE